MKLLTICNSIPCYGNLERAKDQWYIFLTVKGNYCVEKLNKMLCRKVKQELCMASIIHFLRFHACILLVATLQRRRHRLQLVIMHHLCFYGYFTTVAVAQAALAVVRLSSHWSGPLFCRSSEIIVCKSSRMLYSLLDVLSVLNFNFYIIYFIQVPKYHALVKIQALVWGHIVWKRVAETLHSMLALVIWDNARIA